MRTVRFAAICAAVAAALVTATVAAPAASATPAAPARASRPTPAYYLSLGDSLGFGFSSDKLAEFEQNHSLADFTGYTDDLAAYLGVKATNLSCPGETTATMIHGGCAWIAAASGKGLPLSGLLHSPYSGPQLTAATAFLSHHRWQRGLITLSIGSDDVLPIAQHCLTDPACPALQPALKTMRANLSTILSSLRRAAPFATVVVLAPYNPFGFAYPATNLPAILFDLNIAGEALVHLDRVADAFIPINGTYQPSGCSPLVNFCPGTSTDVHPTNAGYAVIAKTFEKALG